MNPPHLLCEYKYVALGTALTRSKYEEYLTSFTAEFVQLECGKNAGLPKCGDNFGQGASYQRQSTSSELESTSANSHRINGRPNTKICKTISSIEQKRKEFLSHVYGNDFIFGLFRCMESS